ncbi:MAG: tetratricopeptide repeat protein [Polyangiaceae bacterium]
MSERERILQSAQKWVEKKRYDRAIEDYQKIVASDPNDARTLLKIGDLQARMQAYPDAIATYDSVGNYYASQGFALKAIAVYKQIRELIRKHAPDLADRYAHIVPRLAEIYTQLGLTSDALQAYDEVATTYQRTGRERDAIEVFRRMVELDGTNPLPHLRLGEACCRVQSLDDAVEAFWTAAELLLKLGRQDDALKVIERILHFKADPKFARMAAELYLARGGREDGMQALAKLQVCFQANPKDLDTLALLAQAFTLIDQPDKSIEVYKEMARIAREGGRHDLFDELLTHLNQVAPHDEGVRSLSQGAPAPVPQRDRSVSAVHVDDAEVEIIEEEPVDITGEEPFELNRQSHPGFRGPQASSPDVVVVDDSLQVAEELIYSEDAEAREHAKKAVVDAESFRRLRLYSKAIEVLHIALEVDPRSIAAREKLREILIESGDRDNAIGESITLASLYLEQADHSRAELMLYEVLEAEPDHPAALQMLGHMGGDTTQAGMEWGAEASTYEAANYDPQAYDQQAYNQRGYENQGYGNQGYENQGYDAQSGYDAQANSAQGYEYQERASGEGYENDEHVAYAEYEYDATATQVGFTEPEFVGEGYDGYDPQAPLPSYDLEEVSASSAMTSTEPFADQGVDPFADASVDEPFADQPLPSFPLGLDYESSPLAAAEPPVAEAAPAPSPAASTEPTATDSLAVEEALEEAEFFVARGLYEDARAIVSDQLSRTPSHPLLLERLREIENILAAAGESRTIDRSQLEAGQQLPHDSESEEDRAFDIAASLEALDQLEQAAPVETIQSTSHDVDVDQVFEKFKQGVRAQVAEADSATHYDLGVAYKEMGLLMDAINEFQLAARDTSRECMCHAMIGMIRLERGELDDAARAYVAALEASQKTVEQEMALYYDLGNVYEMKSSPKEALYYFQKIARRDPGYRDVSDRIATLAPDEAPQPAQKAANGDEDFDAVFDDLFESK